MLEISRIRESKVEIAQALKTRNLDVEQQLDNILSIDILDMNTTGFNLFGTFGINPYNNFQFKFELN